MPKGMSTLVFEDNFTRFDRSVWSLRGQEVWGDNQAHAESSYEAYKISGEMLRMILVPDPDTPGDVLIPHYGTQYSFQFFQGYAEARMRFYPYHGMHAAFWLQSEGPYERGRPEIDVAEYFGAHNPERKTGINLYSNVYYRDEPGTEILGKQIYTNSVEFGANWYQEFHNYGVLWTDDGYEFFIDGKSTGQITGVIDTSPKYLVLSNLVRDYEWPHIAEHPLDTYKTSVDWVRVWQ